MADNKKMSVAEILAAARKADSKNGGGAESAPAAAQAASVNESANESASAEIQASAHPPVLALPRFGANCGAKSVEGQTTCRGCSIAKAFRLHVLKAIQRR